MRLSTFIADDGRLRTGAVLTGERLLDFTSVATSLPFDGADMLSLIASGQAGLDAASELVARHPDGTHDLHAVRLLAPIPRPRKNIFCVGWNYLEHFEESKKLGKSIDLPAFPTFFSKAPTTANGPYDAVTIDPAISEMIDWEAELALVIGSAGSNISEEQASAHVFGYMVLNDVSAREVQRRHGGQWFKGKSLDGFAPMGPWIVTADELDPSAGLQYELPVLQDSPHHRRALQGDDAGAGRHHFHRHARRRRLCPPTAAVPAARGHAGDGGRGDRRVEKPD
jgi:2-keto-4-pentenoate hydratase/2-oxohepta-3-ene-1,7-dioic acid hydratase in catechol pathway